MLTDIVIATAFNIIVSQNKTQPLMQCDHCNKTLFAKYIFCQQKHLQLCRNYLQDKRGINEENVITRQESRFKVQQLLIDIIILGKIKNRLNHLASLPVFCCGKALSLFKDL